MFPIFESKLWSPTVLAGVCAGAVGYLSVAVWAYTSTRRKRLLANNLTALQEYKIPSTVRAVFRRENPKLTDFQEDLAFEGLKQYFSLLLLERARTKKVALGMPSALVDEAWHAFVLCTEQYEVFCQKIFGKMVHHYPDTRAQPTRLGSYSKFKQDVINTWSAASRAKKTHPKYFPNSKEVPLLFSADIDGGFLDGWLWNADAIEQLILQTRNHEAVKSSADVDGSADDLGFLTGGACFGSPGGSSKSHDSHGDGSSCSSDSGSSDSSSGGSSCGSSCGSGCGGD